MTTIPYRAPQRPTPTLEAVLAYCTAGHTNADAALHFGITDRYVRKLKSRARGEPSGGSTTVPPEGIVSDPPPAEPTPHYATVTSSAVARDGHLWKCPICGEMMAPLPGTTGAEWAESGCYLHQAKPPVTSTQAELMAGTGDAQQVGPEEQDRTGEHEDLSPCLDVPARNTEQHATHTGGTGPQEQQPVIVRERVVQRVVIREREPVGLVAFVRDHPIFAHQAVALIIVAILIYVASFG